MYAIHYFENNTPTLSQCLRRIPAIEEAINLKGRKGKVVNVVQIAEDKYHVHIELEKIVKKEILVKDDKKRR